jgi:hypothetical protein
VRRPYRSRFLTVCSQVSTLVLSRFNLPFPPGFTPVAAAFGWVNDGIYLFIKPGCKVSWCPQRTQLLRVETFESWP